MHGGSIRAVQVSLFVTAALFLAGCKFQLTPDNRRIGLANWLRTQPVGVVESLRQSRRPTNQGSQDANGAQPAPAAAESQGGQDANGAQPAPSPGGAQDANEARTEGQPAETKGAADPKEAQRALLEAELGETRTKLRNKEAVLKNLRELDGGERTTGSQDGSVEKNEKEAAALRKRIELLEARVARFNGTLAEPLATERVLRLESEARTAEVDAASAGVRFQLAYKEQVRKDLERSTQLERDEIGWLTRTQASAVFTPSLKMVQPALVQSFSLRNFLQRMWPAANARVVRTTVERNLALSPVISLDHGSGAFDGSYDTNLLTADQRRLLVDSIVADAVADRFWFQSLDIISADIGLTTGSLAFGDESSSFERRVDDEFPQFLFGGGLHFGSFEASTGAMLFRDNDSRFKWTYYFGLSIDLFKTRLGVDSTDSSE